MGLELCSNGARSGIGAALFLRLHFRKQKQGGDGNDRDAESTVRMDDLNKTTIIKNCFTEKRPSARSVRGPTAKQTTSATFAESL